MCSVEGRLVRGQPADCYYALRGRAGGFQTLLKAPHTWGLEELDLDAEKVNRGGLRLCGSGEAILHAGWRLDCSC